MTFTYLYRPKKNPQQTPQTHEEYLNTISLGCQPYVTVGSYVIDTLAKTTNNSVDESSPGTLEKREITVG